MQYLVHSEGKVLDNRKKSYVISAKTEEEARLIAEKTFLEEHHVVDGQVYTKPLARNRKAICAYILLLVPILLSFIEWKSGHDTICIRPDFVSCIYAILFYALYVLRFKGVESVLKMTDSWVDLGFCVVIPLLFSTFVKILFVSEKVSLLGIFEFELDTKFVFPVAIILSLLGIKLMSVICMGSIFFLALFNIVNLNESMGSIWGPAYVICAFVGILLYCSVEPAFHQGLTFFGGSLKRGVNHEMQDFVEAKKSVKKVGNTISNLTGNKKNLIEKENLQKED